MSSFVRNNDSNATKCTESDSNNLPTDSKLTESNNSSLPVSNCKTLAELASETLVCSAAEFIKVLVIQMKLKKFWIMLKI